MNPVRSRSLSLAAALGLALQVSGARPRELRAPWAGGFPQPVLTLWRDHDRLAQWTMPPSIEAIVAGTTASATVSWSVPIHGGGRSTGVGAVSVSAWASSPDVVDLGVNTARPAGATSVTVDLPLALGEHIVGLGERFGRLDLRGGLWDNQAADQAGATTHSRTYSPTPFLISSAGYGLAMDTDYPAVFDVGASRSDRLIITMTDPHPHLRLLTGGSPGDIIARQAVAVGLPPLSPQWGLGVWKTLIGGATRVRADAAHLRAAGVPIDSVWIYDAMDDRSGFGWRWPIYDPIPLGGYPDVPGLIQAFHQAGTKVLGYLAPFVYRGSAAFTDAVTHGYLIVGADGRPVLENWGGTTRGQVDFSNPAAAAWFTDRVASGLSVVGFDGAMQDYGESAPVEAAYASGLPGAAEHNRYPLRYAQAVEAAEAATKPGQAVFFARSGGLGTQHYATARFTGDQLRSWDPARGLPSALHAMLSGSVSGWPYWGPDIAGFVQADSGNDERELWTRWLELGALSPIMRDMLGAAHQATDALTDEHTLAVFRAYARLHTALEPYLYRLATVAHDSGLPIVRPLFLVGPRDPVAWTVDDEYQLGDDVLVAPVLRPGQTTRRLYLPAGAWRDYWTATDYRGPGWIDVPAPVDHVPLLVRQGADLRLPDPATLWLPPGSLGLPAVGSGPAGNR